MHVASIRRRLGVDRRGLLASEPGGYRLSGLVATDVGHFEELTARAVDEPELKTRRDLLHGALRLWRGGVVADLAALGFRHPKIVELEARRWSALNARFEADLAIGEDRHLVPELERLVIEQPFREDVASLLARALYRSGRPTDALRVVADLTRHLRDEVGVEPSPETRSLERQLLEHSPRLLPAGRAAGDTGPATGAPSGDGDHSLHRDDLGRPSGTVTFLFTDVEGSTMWWDQHPADMSEAMARHDEVLLEVIARHGGLVISHGGDGLAAAFARASAAIRAAVDGQRAFTGQLWPGQVTIRVRIGLHTGEAQERDGTYLGPTLNCAARLMAGAHGGQIVVSDATAAVADLAEDLRLVDAGYQRLRGFATPVRAFTVDAEGLPRIDRPLNTSGAVRGNVRRGPTPWFGPTRLLDRLVTGLSDRRLLTLTGTGGVGKTRLALEIADRAQDQFPDGAWTVELAPIADPTAALRAVATVVGVSTPTEAALRRSIVESLGQRRLLLLLDNCEHVLEPIAELVDTIVVECQEVTVVATSREPLHVRGERVIPVPQLSTRDGTALFCDRAVAGEEGLSFDDADIETVTAICERLDGIPLAIELAAARSEDAVGGGDLATPR